MTHDGAEPRLDVDDDNGRDRDRRSRARALGAGLGMLVVALTYDASQFDGRNGWWYAAVAVAVGVLLADGLVLIRTMLPTPGVAPLPIAAAMVAMYLCVPETDQFSIVALLLAALVILEVAQRRQLPIEWYVVAAAAVGWGGMFGAGDRQSALAGALFAWWAVVQPGFVFAWRRVDTPWRAWAIAVVAAAATMVMARTGGLAATWPVIIASVAACAVVSLLAAVALVGHSADRSPT